MENSSCQKLIFLLVLSISSINVFSQERSIGELDFLIGTWELREDNEENGWWEKSTRVGRYTLDSTYIELETHALSSDGKQRTYRWFIHYNKKEKQFEMLSMFGNWYKIQFDIIEWDALTRTLTIRNGRDLGADEYHERFGEIVFDEDFSKYAWTGENKYGDRNQPSIWKYEEKGIRVK
ncbi:MAG: hypothetical protein RIB47_01170 [Cyclobacteriaceae bacterium]